MTSRVEDLETALAHQQQAVLESQKKEDAVLREKEAHLDSTAELLLRGIQSRILDNHVHTQVFPELTLTTVHLIKNLPYGNYVQEELENDVRRRLQKRLAESFPGRAVYRCEISMLRSTETHDKFDMVGNCAVNLSCCCLPALLCGTCWTVNAIRDAHYPEIFVTVKLTKPNEAREAAATP